jgi:hypothetical protein
VRAPACFRVFIICVAVALPALALPAGAHAATSCGNFASLGTLTGKPGDTLTYNVSSTANPPGPTFTATLNWGEGSPSSTNVSPGDQKSVSHTYNNAGTFNVSIKTSGQLNNGTACSDNKALGKVVIKAPPPSSTPSCGTFQSLGTQALTAGEGLTYTVESRGASLDSAAVFWGDLTSDGTSGPIGPNQSRTLPEPPPSPNPHIYSTPGTYSLSLSTTGHLGNGTPCADDKVSIGTVVVSAAAPPPPPPPAPASTPGVTQQQLPAPPSGRGSATTVAAHKCSQALARGRLGRIFRKGTHKRITCRKVRGGHRCRATWRSRARGGFRFTARVFVPAKGRVRVLSVRRRR